MERLKEAVNAGRDKGSAWCQAPPNCVGGSTQFWVAGKPLRFLFGYLDAGVNATADIGAWVSTSGVTGC